MFRWLKRRQRGAIRLRPFPPGWNAIVEKNVPFAGCLTAADREELFGDVQVFLEEKRFEGCGGMRITDEIRVTIATQACVLLLHRVTDFYPDLISILVYPSMYAEPVGRISAEGLIVGDHRARLGESSRDVVVLAWDHVLSGASDMRDGHNVVLHEFAHQLDQESGADDGAPILPRRSMYVAWARILGREFDALVRDAQHNHRTLIDRYGATNPAEFFAVATETFFEKPRQLKSKHPELYDELQLFYQQDPASFGN